MKAFTLAIAFAVLPCASGCMNILRAYDSMNAASPIAEINRRNFEQAFRECDRRADELAAPIQNPDTAILVKRDEMRRCMAANGY